MDAYELSTLTPREIYDTYVENVDPDELISAGRTAIATRLMTEHQLEDRAAYYAADQILVRADQIIASHSSIPPSDF